MRVLACLPLTVLVAASPLPAPSGCPKVAGSVADASQRAQVHPLNQEPGARQDIAVLRTDRDGCIHPVVVRENVGGKSPAVRSTQSTLQTVAPR